MANQAQITEFILTYLHDNGAPAQISAQTDYVAEGLLDSFGILQLIMMLESQYQVKFETRQLADTGLRQVGCLAALVADLIERSEAS
jgi:acyl carrier protein